MKNDIQLTQRGREKLDKKIQELEQKLVTVRSRKGEASDIGGNAWHDNSDFEELEMQERILMTEISEIKYKIQHAILIDSLATNSKIAIGSKVKLRYVDSGEIINIEIVGHGEGDPARGLVSYDSPLGGCIIGAQKNDIKLFKIDANDTQVKIEDVS